MINKNFIIKLLTIFLFSLFSFGSAFANWPDQGTMYGNYHMMGSGTGWMMFVFWGLVLWILILVIRWVINLSKDKNNSSQTQKSAMEILKERFAKGEINITEFESKREVIKDFD
ncbi:MAG: SHOCT domain-containing protein [Deltaproteobacteria bacterium]|jgi:putative membrane protein|nr:SHOCT domain-containing protein [Deltaproteobacteria bacterium]